MHAWDKSAIPERRWLIYLSRYGGREVEKVPVLILESRQPDMLGDLSIYRSISDAENALEAIDVLNREFFGYMLDGRRLAFGVEGNSVRIAIEDRGADHSPTVRKLMEDYTSIIVSRKKTGMMNIPAMSLDELVAVVGFG